MKIKKRNLLGVCLIIGALFTGCGSKKSTIIELKGSDTILNVSQGIAEKYMAKNPDTKIAVTGGGSGVGISSLLNKTTDIAMASRSMKEKEYEKAEEAKVKVQEIVLGYDGITIIVNNDNQVKDISSKKLGEIFRGEITNWKDIGGTDSPIVVLSRDSSSGTHEFFKEHIIREGKKNQKEYGSQTLYAPSNQAIKQEVKNNINAIGYIGMGYMDDTVHSLAVDGITPSVENVADKSYPIAREVYWYVPENSDKSEAIDNLVDFAISKDGQEIVKNEGFIPRSL
ncbi:phosphate ABC transporter substrate-binding protein [Fusobacterium sp. MFO224]|uniref:phosphate ABC transporter substrate-binding protein n=1 Tax=Fusobacterium sp. MFO224 TaxID=3378070 RepID=UPI003852C5CE